MSSEIRPEAFKPMFSHPFYDRCSLVWGGALRNDHYKRLCSRLGVAKLQLKIVRFITPYCVSIILNIVLSFVQ